MVNYGMLDLSICFLSLKESTREARQIFLFHFEGFFCSSNNQTQIFECYDFIKCLNMKHETHFTE